MVSVEGAQLPLLADLWVDQEMPATLQALVRAKTQQPSQLPQHASAFHRGESRGGGSRNQAEISRKEGYSLREFVSRKRVRSPSMEKILEKKSNEGEELAKLKPTPEVEENLLASTFPPIPPLATTWPVSRNKDFVELGSERGSEDSPLKFETPSRTEQDVYEVSEDEQDQGEAPGSGGGFKLWHFVKGFSPRKPSIIKNLFGSWHSKTPEERGLDEVDAQKVPQERRKLGATKGRSTLPTKKRNKERPNVKKVLKHMSFGRWQLAKKRKALEEDFDANSSRSAKESRRRTVSKILATTTGKRAGSQVDGEDIKAVAAVLKDYNYKSAHLYLAELKLLHIEANDTWTQFLERIYKQCKLSTSRGLGPRKKAVEVPEDVWATPVSEVRGNKIKLLQAQRLFAMGVQWMMREIEIAALKSSNVRFDEVNKTVMLTWEECKTDQVGRTITRMLQCQCKDICDMRCPFDNLKKILGEAESRRKEADEDPWIAVARSGKPASKHVVLASWRSLFGKKVTGHSTRRSGALQYIRKGWSVSQVAFLGRWKSNIILQYVRR